LKKKVRINHASSLTLYRKIQFENSVWY